MGLQEGKWELRARLVCEPEQARAWPGVRAALAPSRNTLSKALTHQDKTRFAARSSGSQQELVPPEQRHGKVVVSFGYPKGCVSLLRGITIALGVDSEFQGCEEAEHRPNYLQSHLYCTLMGFGQRDIGVALSV